MIKKGKIKIPGIALFVIVLYILFCFIAQSFFSWYNFVLILRNSCTLLIVSLGMTWSILIAQTDLSVGSVMSMGAVMSAVMSNAGIPTVAIVICVLAMGVGVGSLNGILISKFKFDFWVTTFSTMSIFAGLALVIANGATVGFENKFYDFIGNATLPGGIYWLIIITALISGICIYVERNTEFGFNMFSVGGCESAAIDSGINVAKNQFLVYLFSGILSSISGILIAGMSNAGAPTVGVDYTFTAMAAVVIGGTPFIGGKGGIVGTIFGTLLLRILTSGLSMMGIAPTWQKAITGVIIVSLIVVDVVNENRVVKNGLRRIYTDAE